MVKVLAVCGNGMGTSLIIKMKVAKFLNDNKISAQVDSCALGEANGRIGGVDIVLCSKHLVGQLNPRQGQQIIGLRNLLDDKEFGPELLAACSAGSAA